jgi:hypothetical protein
MSLVMMLTLNTLEEGTLAPRTPEQWVLAKNRLLGSIAYENFLRNTTVGGSNTYEHKHKNCTTT